MYGTENIIKLKILIRKLIILIGRISINKINGVRFYIFMCNLIIKKY